jgi:UTP-glucose-1-phosphate uridylyltransferase
MDLKMTAKIFEFPLGKVTNKELMAQDQYKNMIHAIVEEFFHNGIEFNEYQQMQIVPALKVLESMIYQHHDLPHAHTEMLDHFVKQFVKS